MTRRESVVDQPLDLRPELAADVIDVDPAECGAAEKGAVRQREMSGPVDQRGDLTCRKKWRIFTHRCKMHPDGERWCLPCQRDGGLVGTADRKHRRRGHDSVAVAADDCVADALGKPEIIGGDQQESAHRLGGRTWRSSRYWDAISATMPLITRGDESVEIPRVI